MLGTLWGWKSIISVVVTIGIGAFHVRCAAQEPIPPDYGKPDEVVAFFLVAKPPVPESSPLRKLIRDSRAKYEAPIAAAMRLPASIEDVDVDAPLGAAKSLPSIMRVFHHRLLIELGRERTEPLLLRVFADSRRLLDQTLAESRLARDEWEKAGGWKTKGSPEDRAELIKLSRTEDTFTGIMGSAMEVAGEMKSPVLVESVLKFYESGLNDRRIGWAAYVVIFADDRPDIIPRLQRVAADPNTDPMVKHQIEMAMDAYTKQHARSEPFAERLAHSTREQTGGRPVAAPLLARAATAAAMELRRALPLPRRQVGGLPPRGPDVALVSPACHAPRSTPARPT